MSMPQPEETDMPEVANLSQMRVEKIQAGMVRANQTAIQEVTADEVDLHTSVSAITRTSNLHASDSLLGLVSSPEATVEDSIAGGIKADTINFEGAAALAIANEISARDVDALAIVGSRVEAGSIKTGLLISREVHGNVTTTLDGRTALMAALVGGSVTGLILLAGKLLFGRND